MRVLGRENRIERSAFGMAVVNYVLFLGHASERRGASRVVQSLTDRFGVAAKAEPQQWTQLCWVMAAGGGRRSRRRRSSCGSSIRSSCGVCRRRRSGRSSRGRCSSGGGGGKSVSK